MFFLKRFAYMMTKFVDTTLEPLFYYFAFTELILDKFTGETFLLVAGLVAILIIITSFCFILPLLHKLILSYI